MQTQATKLSPLLQSIDVDELFGQHHYRIRSAASLRGDDQLLLLYGDNGADKSTILSIVFHLLSPVLYGGHRTAVSRIPFRTVRIVLTSGHIVVASKEEPFDQSYYQLQLFQSDAEILTEYTWEREKKGREHPNPAYSKYCEILQNIGLQFYFLSDTRHIVGQFDPERDDSRTELVQRLLHRDRQRTLRRHDQITAEAEIVVGEAVDRTLEGLRRLALTRTSVGYTSVNTIYEELISGIVEHGDGADESRLFPISELRQNLIDLRSRNSTYAKYGLTPYLDTDRLLTLLNRAQHSSVEILNTVLKPYFDGHHARLNALEPAQKVIDEFVTMLSEFFAHKVVELDVTTGLIIKDRQEKQIPPELLSSGERQLVVLLCNAIAARKDGTILVIDEPEISLNVKWQRRLISALLRCLEGVDTQIILATHSIEILSQYREHVATLTDLYRGS